MLKHLQQYTFSPLLTFNLEKKTFCVVNINPEKRNLSPLVIQIMRFHKQVTVFCFGPPEDLDTIQSKAWLVQTLIINQNYPYFGDVLFSNRGPGGKNAGQKKV